MLLDRYIHAVDERQPMAIMAPREANSSEFKALHTQDWRR